jgi:hypothetical protein
LFGCHIKIYFQYYRTVADKTFGLVEFSSRVSHFLRRFPAPCVLMGRGELVQLYFFTGLIIPLIFLLFLERETIMRSLHRILQKQNLFSKCCREGDTEDSKNSQEVEEEEQVVLPSAGSQTEERAARRTSLRNMAVVRRLRILNEKKAKRSPLHTAIIEAAIPQTSIGQAWVNY